MSAPVCVIRHAIVIEKAEGTFSAYVPDLPGCLATGATAEEVESETRETIAFRVEGLGDDGLPVSPGASQVEYVALAAQLVIPSDCLRRPLNLGVERSSGGIVKGDKWRTTNASF
jgi:predicted RNase H-like HicB family nuclease